MACTLLRGQILVKLVIAIATIDFFLFENCNCNLNNACDESSQELFSNIFILFYFMNKHLCMQDPSLKYF